MNAGKSKLTLILTLTAFLLVAAACSSSSTGSSPGSTSAPAGNPSTDKLVAILARGTLILSTDPAYPPASFAVKGAVRAANTKCASNELTAPEIDGYDAATGKAVAAALGVEPCFVSPTWTAITGGNWGDRWDVSWGSGGINADRMTRLYMTQPYYRTPQAYFVQKHSTYQTPADLNGKRIGVCSACSHQLYLEGNLVVPGEEIVPTVKDPKIVVFDTEEAGLPTVADGKIDAFLCSEPIGVSFIDQGLALRELKQPGFQLDLTGFIDKSSSLDQRAFVARVNETILSLIADGTLPAASEKYFGTDYATAAAAFNMDAIGQTVTAP